MSQTVNLDTLEHIIEAAIMAHESPMSLVQLANLFEEDQRPDTKTLKMAIENLQNACANRGVELKQVASGYRYQAKQEFAPWLRKLWEERPTRYSRALMETLALIIYRQPITRAEIEEIRGVSVSSNLVKTLMERGWVKEVGVREVLGRPALLATTQEFLDYFNIHSLSELPTLQELTDLDIAGTELEKQMILLEQEQQQAEADHDKAAADAIDMEIERFPIELVDEEQIEQEIMVLESKHAQPESEPQEQPAKEEEHIPEVIVVEPEEEIVVVTTEEETL